jgi:hypothetical protein
VLWCALQPGSRPTAALDVGQDIKVVVVPAGGKKRSVQVSAVPAVVAAAAAHSENAAADDPFVPPQAPAPAVCDVATGIVEKVGRDGMAVRLSRGFSAHVYALHASSDPDVAGALRRHFQARRPEHSGVVMSA